MKINLYLTTELYGSFIYAPYKPFCGRKMEALSDERDPVLTHT
jgi:hypothetical protein